MVIRDNTGPRSARPAAPPVPQQGRRRAALCAQERSVRQVQAIDAWVADRRRREQLLFAGSLTREERLAALRDLEVLRRTHDAIKGQCARDLADEVAPMRRSGPTAVLAHRYAWFVEKLALVLAGHGVTIVACTDNGAEALGAVVAAQPDLVLVGDRLAMLAGRTLLAQTRQYAPHALLTAHASDPYEAGILREGIDALFLRHQGPAAVADALATLQLTGPEPSVVERHPLRMRRCWP